MTTRRRKLGRLSKLLPSQDSSATLTTTTTVSGIPTGAVAARAATTGIKGSYCTGQTQNIHKSYYFASVHGTTICKNKHSIMASVTLMRSNWYGWLTVSNGANSGLKVKADANAKWYCKGVGTYTYAASTYHRAIIGGEPYATYTSKQNRFWC